MLHTLQSSTSKAAPFLVQQQQLRWQSVRNRQLTSSSACRRSGSSARREGGAREAGEAVDVAGNQAAGASPARQPFQSHHATVGPHHRAALPQMALLRAPLQQADLLLAPLQELALLRAPLRQAALLRPLLRQIAPQRAPLQQAQVLHAPPLQMQLLRTHLPG